MFIKISSEVNKLGNIVRTVFLETLGADIHVDVILMHSTHINAILEQASYP